jgi:uncharacterized protein (TIGR02001 family)
MKRALLIILLGGLVAASLPAAAAVVDFNAAYVSKYIWRGYDLNGTQPALQPGATFYLGNTGLTAGIWGSYNLGSMTKQEMTEVDYTLTYANSLGEDWNYSIYYSLYNFPPVTGPGAKSGELFLSVTGNNLLLKPTLTYSYDNDQGNGSYVSLNVKSQLPVGPLPLDCCLTVGYDGGQYGVKPGISDATLALSSAVPAGQATITPLFSYTVVGKDSRPAADNVFWFSLNVASSL